MPKRARFSRTRRLRLFPLDGEHYVLDREAAAGTVLRTDDPIHVEINPGMLG